MAKNATQATGTNQDESAAQTIFASGLDKFGKKEFMKAAEAAKNAIHAVQGGDKEIRRLNGEIELKREGNTAVLWRLAKECVKIATHEGTADLAKAADLMELACQYVEAVTELDFRKENPEATEAKIRHIVPSWPVLRANSINAMRKANLNPNDFPKPSGMLTAYKAWKENPANAGQVAQTGRAPRAAQSGQVTAEVRKVAEVVAKLTDSARSMLDNIATHLLQLNEKGQKHALDKILTPAYGELVNLVNGGAYAVGGEAEDAEAAKDKAAGVQTRRRIPARVPESNQIAS